MHNQDERPNEKDLGYKTYYTCNFFGNKINIHTPSGETITVVEIDITNPKRPEIERVVAYTVQMLNKTLENDRNPPPPWITDLKAQINAIVQKR